MNLLLAFSNVLLWIVVAVLGFAVLGLYRVNGKLLLGARIGSEPTPGMRLPRVQVKTIDGEVVPLADGIGGPRLIQFVSSGCGSCKETLKVLRVWAEQDGPQSRAKLTVVVVGGLSENVRDQLLEVVPASAEVLHDSGWDAAAMWGCRRVPWCLCVDGRGNVLASGQPVTIAEFDRMVSAVPAGMIGTL